jgi:lysine N6-hydroxylase
MKEEKDLLLDVAGVGIGPFNLSVAALLQPLEELQVRFYDRAPEFQWHSGLLFPEATIQVSFLKDLVTLADPTSPYSFLSFLYATKRLYRFINVNYTKVTRVEFNQYFRWVCASLPSLRLGCPVEAIFFDGDTLALDTGGEVVRARNVVLGSGLTPVIPECASPHLGPTVFHATRYLKQNVTTAGQRIAVIGGGQTGAEVFNHLLSDSTRLPRELYWVSRRPNYLPLDESPFTNELFSPNYSNYFFKLPNEDKPPILAQQKLASDGIAKDLLDTIYRKLYELEFLDGKRCVSTLCPNRELIEMSAMADGSWSLALWDEATNQARVINADIVVLCTGADYKPPAYLDPLMDRIPLDRGRFLIRDDFSIEWDGPEALTIYVQNAARHSPGVAAPPLS